jgi:hypothetical protein
MNSSEDKIAPITKDDWASYCKHLQTLVERYWEKDGQLPVVTASVFLGPRTMTVTTAVTTKRILML